VRFENVRDGFEDSELLSLLAAQGGKHEADDLAAGVAGSIDLYSSNPAALAAAHINLLEQLEKSSTRSPKTSSLRFVQ
jgi:hypothetical protein